jgi:hypothetical protein
MFIDDILHHHSLDFLFDAVLRLQFSFFFFCSLSDDHSDDEEMFPFKSRSKLKVLSIYGCCFLRFLCCFHLVLIKPNDHEIELLANLLARGSHAHPPAALERRLITTGSWRNLHTVLIPKSARQSQDSLGSCSGCPKKSQSSTFSFRKEPQT